MTGALLGPLARAAGRRPRATVLVGTAACALLGLLALARLGFDTARIALVGDVPFVRRHLALEEEFGDLNAIVVAVRGRDLAETRAVGDALAHDVLAEPDVFRGCFHRVAPESFGGRALLFLDRDQLRALDAFLARLLPELRRGTLAGCLAGFAAELERRVAEGTDDGGSAELLAWARGLLADAREAASGGTPKATVFDALPEWDTAGYSWAGDGETLILLVDFREAQDGDGLDPRTRAVERLRELVARQRQRWPGVEIGVTGKPTLEVDEMRTYERDSLRASLVALGLVTLLLVLAFRRWSGPLLVGGCLALAVAATLGLAALWPGYLNLMAVVFVVVVIGLGVDFGIHLVSAYDEALAAGAPPPTALEEAFERVGPAIVAGGLTTVGAFGVATLTEFKGLREFGAVAALGVLASLVVMLTVLPGLLVLLDRDRRTARLPRPPRAFRWLDRALRHWPKTSLCLVLVCCALSVLAVARLRYRSNLLLLQDQRLQSVQLELSLLRDRQTTGWFLAYATPDLEALRAAARVARALPGVRRVESVLDVLPPRQAERLPLVRRVQERLAAALAAPPPATTPEALRAALDRLEGTLEEALEAALAGGREQALGPLDELLEATSAARAVAERADPAALARYDRRLAERFAARARPLANPPAAPITPATLPGGLRARLVGARGSYLLRMYPREDLWDPAALERFVEEVRARIPEVTGVPVLMHESSRLMLSGYVDAGLYALAVVAACVLVLTRSLRWTLLCLLSLGVGGLWTVGLLVLCGGDLNPANLVGLPLLLGVGIDTSVHVVHRLRSEARAGVAYSSLGRALLYSGLTSAAGFGSLLLADHPGTASIGSAISLGVVGCLAAGFVVPPLVVHLARGDAQAPLQ